MKAYENINLISKDENIVKYRLKQYCSGNVQVNNTLNNIKV